MLDTATPAPLIAIPQVAETLGICRASVYRLIKAGQLPTVVVGSRRRLVRSSDLSAFVENLTDVARA
jgi:excisionase family DNA binding protein